MKSVRNKRRGNTLLLLVFSVPLVVLMNVVEVVDVVDDDKGLD